MKRPITLLTLLFFLFSQFASAEAAWWSARSHLRTPSASDGARKGATPTVKILRKELSGQNLTARDGGEKSPGEEDIQRVAKRVSQKYNLRERGERILEGYLHYARTKQGLPYAAALQYAAQELVSLKEKAIPDLKAARAVLKEALETFKGLRSSKAFGIPLLRSENLLYNLRTRNFESKISYDPTLFIGTFLLGIQRIGLRKVIEPLLHQTSVLQMRGEIQKRAKGDYADFKTVRALMQEVMRENGIDMEAVRERILAEVGSERKYIDRRTHPVLTPLAILELQLIPDDVPVYRGYGHQYAGLPTGRLGGDSSEWEIGEEGYRSAENTAKIIATSHHWNTTVTKASIGELRKSGVITPGYDYNESNSINLVHQSGESGIVTVERVKSFSGKTAARDGGGRKKFEPEEREVVVPRDMTVDETLKTLFPNLDPHHFVMLRLTARDKSSRTYEVMNPADVLKQGDIVDVEGRDHLYFHEPEDRDIEEGLSATPLTMVKVRRLLNQVLDRQKTLKFVKRKVPEPAVGFVWITGSKTIYLHQIQAVRALDDNPLAVLEAIVTQWDDLTEENVPTAARQKYGEAFERLKRIFVVLKSRATAPDGGTKETVERTPQDLMSYLHTLLEAGTVTYHPDEKEGDVILEWSLRDGEPDRLRSLFIPKHLTDAKAMLRAVILRLSSERLYIPEWHAEDSPIDTLKALYNAWDAEDGARKAGLTASDGGEHQAAASIPERARYLRTEYGEHLRMRSSGVVTEAATNHDLNLLLTIRQFYGGVRFTDLVRQYGPEKGSQVDRAIRRIERSANRIDDLIGKGKLGSAQVVREEAISILESLRFLSNVGNGEFAEDGGRHAAPFSPFRQDAVFYP